MSFLGRSPGMHMPTMGGDAVVSGKRVAVVRQIAEGGFGFISIVQDPATNRTLVLKRSIAQNPEAARMAKMEVELLKRLSHPNIVRCEGSETRTYAGGGIEALLLLEYCPGGHLLDYLNSLQGQHLPEREVLDIHRQITSAVEYLHTRDPPIVHRDLKLENVLRLGSVLKLCDFGSCVAGHVPLSNAVERANAEEVIEKSTTQMYRAPEMCDLYMQPVLTEKTDVWALGCMLYATCFLVHPFNNAGNLGIINARITFPSTSPYGEDMHNLILHQLQQDANARASAGDVLQFIHQIAAGQSIPTPAADPEPEVQRPKPPQKPPASTKPVLKQPKQRQLDPNSLAARRLAERKGGRRRSYTETDAAPDLASPQPTPHNRRHHQQQQQLVRQDQTEQLIAGFDAFGLGSGGASSVPAASFGSFGDFGGFEAFTASQTSVTHTSSTQIVSTVSPHGQRLPEVDTVFDPFALGPAPPSPQRQSSSTIEQSFDPFGISPSSPTAGQGFAPVASPRVDFFSQVSVSSRVSVSERISSRSLPKISTNLSRSPEDFHSFAMSPSTRTPNHEQVDLFDLFGAPATPTAAATSAATTPLARHQSAPTPSSTGFDPFAIGATTTSQQSQPASVPTTDLFNQHSSPMAAGAHAGVSFHRSASDGYWPSPGGAHQSHPAFQNSFQQSMPSHTQPQHRSGHIRQMTSPAAPGYGQLFTGAAPLQPQAHTQFDQFFGAYSQGQQRPNPRF